MNTDKLFQLLPKSIRDSFRTTVELLRKPQMKKFYSKFVKPDSLVFDIGANIGDYSQHYLDLDAKVIAIDPQPFCIKKLEDRFSNNKNVVIVPKGVSNKKGFAILNIDEDNHATSTFSSKFKKYGLFSNRSWNKKIKVPVTTLDLLIKKYGKPNYCKIDVEGYEYQVLKGLSEKIPFISFEFSIKLLDEVEKCLQYLNTLGNPKFNYSLSYSSCKLRLKKWTKSKDLLLSKIQSHKIDISGDIFVKF